MVLTTTTAVKCRGTPHWIHASHTCKPNVRPAEVPLSRHLEISDTSSESGAEQQGTDERRDADPENGESRPVTHDVIQPDGIPVETPPDSSLGSVDENSDDLEIIKGNIREDGILTEQETVARSAQRGKEVRERATTAQKTVTGSELRGKGSRKRVREMEGDSKNEPSKRPRKGDCWPSGIKRLKHKIIRINLEELKEQNNEITSQTEQERLDRERTLSSASEAVEESERKQTEHIKRSKKVRKPNKKYSAPDWIYVILEDIKVADITHDTNNDEDSETDDEGELRPS